jgi:hypothetical protein
MTVLQELSLQGQFLQNLILAVISRDSRDLFVVHRYGSKFGDQSVVVVRSDE